MKNTIRSEKLAILGGKPVLKNPLSPYSSLGKEEKIAVARVMDKKILSGFLGVAGERFLGGEYVRKLEKLMCRIFKVKYAVSFNSATTALQGAVAAAGIGPGDEVVTSPFTMTATASAILLNNALPIFADLDPFTYSLDHKSVEERITSRTRAIILVNIFGGSSDFKNILPVARKYRLKVIEDNAQAITARYGNKFLGTVGDMGIFSLNVHKHIQCGEGGVLVTNNDDLAFRAQLVRNHAEAVIDGLYEKQGIYQDIIGSNYRLGELHAAIAIEQLKKRDKLIKPRVKLANYLTIRLKAFSWLEPTRVTKNSTHVYYVYPIRFFSKKIGIKRKIFAEAMAAEGFPLGQGYVKPIYLMPLYQKRKIYPSTHFPFLSSEFQTNVAYKRGLCPIAERLYEKEFLSSTICQEAKSEDDIDLFIRAIEKVECHRKELARYEKRK